MSKLFLVRQLETKASHVSNTTNTFISHPSEKEKNFLSHNSAPNSKDLDAIPLYSSLMVSGNDKVVDKLALHYTDNNFIDTIAQYFAAFSSNILHGPTLCS
jgi:hypothetical protein